MDLTRIISVAKGDAPADLLFKNARVVNTAIGEVERGDVVICEDRIAGVGSYDWAKEIIDLKGSYLSPGLINGHTHIESSMLHPARYAQAVVPRGTSTLITDLHEITNVCGIRGIEFITECANQLPLDMLFMAPSCVPATHMETSGAEINSTEIGIILNSPRTIGLGEMMNFPGVINGDKEVLAKLIASRSRVIDGHAPGLGGKDLNAYMAAGILSDHESTTLEEGEEKLRKGMWLMIREGSSEKNLEALLPLVTDKTYRRCLFVVDDRNCFDLLHSGDIDAVVRKAINMGLDPVRAIQLATINSAEYFRLYDRGIIAPGYLANLITITDLSHLTVDKVFYRGKLVAAGGKATFVSPDITSALTDTVHIKPFSTESLKLRFTGEDFPIIEMEKMEIIAGEVIPDPKRDILKLAVVERHKATGNIGIGMVKGFGIKEGALASSVAHDSHNVLVVGTNDLDMAKAIKEIEKMEGGLTVCRKGEILASLPLPVAGLLSQETLVTVVSRLEEVEKAAHSLGKLPPSPFSILSFLALPVIPELRLTDKGIVDVNEFKLIM